MDALGGSRGVSVGDATLVPGARSCPAEKQQQPLPCGHGFPEAAGVPPTTQARGDGFRFFVVTTYTQVTDPVNPQSLQGYKKNGFWSWVTHEGGVS